MNKRTSRRGVRGLVLHPNQAVVVSGYDATMYAGLTSNHLLSDDIGSLGSWVQIPPSKEVAQRLEHKPVSRSISVNSTGGTFNTRIKNGEHPIIPTIRTIEARLKELRLTKPRMLVRP